MNLKALALAVVFAAPVTVFACEGEGHTAELAAPKKVTVTELAKLTSAKAATVFDANNNEFRAKNGVIPGAILLTSSSEFALTELPAKKDAKVVFYCASEKCNASSGAAKKALGAGYTDVSVLPDGLTGWKKAGQKTASFKPNS
ncbi:MAG: Rhodanese domain protein [Myxococcaceae bacterium]|nr:Rhodanese domain protein [Myxococcaceae bacterium]